MKPFEIAVIFSGTGFKGCYMALVNPEYREEIVSKITKEYLKEFPNLEECFNIHFCHMADGVCL